LHQFDPLDPHPPFTDAGRTERGAARHNRPAATHAYRNHMMMTPMTRKRPDVCGSDRAATPNRIRRSLGVKVLT